MYKPNHNISYLAFLADDARAAIACFFDTVPEHKNNSYLKVALERLMTVESNTLDVVPRSQRQDL